jgi:hypothetical protein
VGILSITSAFNGPPSPSPFVTKVVVRHIGGDQGRGEVSVGSIFKGTGGGLRSYFPFSIKNGWSAANTPIHGIHRRVVAVLDCHLVYFLIALWQENAAPVSEVNSKSSSYHKPASYLIFTREQLVVITDKPEPWSNALQETKRSP